MTQTSEETKPKTRTSFNVDSDVLREFKEACRREDVLMSDAVTDLLKTYVSAHSVGKPQLRMDHFNGKTPHPKHPCQKCGVEKPLLKVKYISGATGEVCKECAQKWRVRGSFGTVAKVLGVAN